MDAAELTRSKKCRVDSRRTLINLSPTGKKLVPKLVAQCERVDQALNELIQETGVDLWSALVITKQSLDKRPLSERVTYDV